MRPPPVPPEEPREQPTLDESEYAPLIVGFSNGATHNVASVRSKGHDHAPAEVLRENGLNREALRLKSLGDPISKGFAKETRVRLSILTGDHRKGSRFKLEQLRLAHAA